MSIIENKLKETRDIFPHHRRKEKFSKIHQAGFNLVPSRSDDPKRPRGNWGEWQTQRQTQKEFSELFFQDTSANFLLVTGFNPWNGGVVVVDLDDLEYLPIVQDRCPPTPLTVETGKGRHFYFRHPGADRRIQQVIKLSLDGETRLPIDIKGDGNYVVSPESTHHSGKTYQSSLPITKELIESLPVYDSSWLPHIPPRKDDEPLDLNALEGSQSFEEALEANWLPSVRERRQQARKYLAKCKGTQQGENANTNAFTLAITILWGFLLPTEEALEVLAVWGERDDQLDSAGIYYPWTPKEIGDKLRSAAKASYSGLPGDKLLQFREEYEASLVVEAERFMSKTYQGQEAVLEVNEVESPLEEKGKPLEVVNDVQQVDPFQADLERSGVTICKRTEVIENEGKVKEVNYQVLCPCGCRLSGWFVIEGKNYFYKCPSGRRSWTEGRSLWEMDQEEWNIYDINELKKLEPIQWQVKNRILESSLAMVYGPSNVGKSFYAINLGLAVASGTPFLGCETKQGPVVYVAGEGAGGINKRVEACLRDREIQGPIDFLVVSKALNLVADGINQGDKLLKFISQRLDGRKPSMIILDTLATHFGGGSVNDLADTGKFVYACKYLREQSGATILVVHHTGKDQSKGERGTVDFRNDSDTIIAIKPAGQGIEIVCDKLRDEERFTSHVLKFKRVEWDGQSSLVLEAVEVVESESSSYPTKSVIRKADLELVRAACPTGIDSAIGKGVLTELFNDQRFARQMGKYGDKKVSSLIDLAVKEQMIDVVPNNNPKRITFYKHKQHSLPVSTLGFFDDQPDVEQLRN